MALPLLPASSPVLRAGAPWGTFLHSTPVMGTPRPLTGCGGAPDVFSRAVEQTTVQPRDTVLARHTTVFTVGAVSGAVS
ncbi:hypothetical protein [Kocuria arenosa]|uniref:hypothetical protein n=1 Tax=Kocuria arenosa TaxID=3071446 RepID=UPI0034D5E08E